MLFKFRSQHLFYIRPNLGGVFPSDKVTVVHNATKWIWKKGDFPKSPHVAPPGPTLRVIDFI